MSGFLHRVALGVCLLGCSLARAQILIGSEWTYQGRLDMGGAPLNRSVALPSFVVNGNSQTEWGNTVTGARPGMAVIVTPPYRLWNSDVIAYAYAESNDVVVWRIKNNDGVTWNYGAAVWRITVIP